MSNLVKFVDGPLAGKSLVLKRAPHFLRGVMSQDGKVDALDQLSDSLASTETAFAYEAGRRDSVHMHICARGGRGGFITQMVEYTFRSPQPSPETMASNREWATWAQAEWVKLQNPEGVS